MNTNEYCKELLEQFPELQTCLHYCNQDQGEILAYVFLEDVRRYLFDHIENCRHIVRFLDDSIYSKGEDIENLIAISIVEYLTQDEIDRLTKGLVSSNLGKEWLKQQQWHHQNTPLIKYEDDCG